MIFLYSGTPGSGKSLHVAKVISYRLQAKKPVIANFNIEVSKISNQKELPFVYLSNDMITPSLLISYSKQYFSNRPIKEGRLLLVIDECQLLFNARDWDMKGRADWLSFFTQHRKFGYDIILIAQFDRMIDRQIRCLIEYEYVHRKVSNYGWKGKMFSFFALGKMFVSVKIWYPMKERVGSEFFLAHKKYYSLYDTYNMFGTDGDGDTGDPATAVPDKVVDSA